LVDKVSSLIINASVIIALELPVVSNALRFAIRWHTAYSKRGYLHTAYTHEPDRQSAIAALSFTRQSYRRRGRENCGGCENREKNCE
jgi:hypothetical protein